MSKAKFLTAALVLIVVIALMPGGFINSKVKSMSTTVWGNLQKALDDDETIEEAIERLIDEHNDDEEAHLGEGQSLQSHKASEIIDHLASSIVNDKIALGELGLSKMSLTEYELVTNFESIDGWDVVGAAPLVSLWGIMLETTGALNNYIRMSATPQNEVGVINWSKSWYFASSVAMGQSDDVLAYWFVGVDEDSATDQKAGFKYEDGVLYAMHYTSDGDEGEEYLTEIEGIDCTDYHIYAVVYDSSVPSLKFYVDGVLVATHDSNLPTENVDTFFTYYIKAKEALVKVMTMKELRMSREI